MKNIGVQVEDWIQETFVDESIRQTRKTGKKVPLKELIVAALERDAIRIQNKAKSTQS